MPFIDQNIETEVELVLLYVEESTVLDVMWVMLSGLESTQISSPGSSPKLVSKR